MIRGRLGANTRKDCWPGSRGQKKQVKVGVLEQSIIPTPCRIGTTEIKQVGTNLGSRRKSRRSPKLVNEQRESREKKETLKRLKRKPNRGRKGGGYAVAWGETRDAKSRESRSAHQKGGKEILPHERQTQRGTYRESPKNKKGNRKNMLTREGPQGQGTKVKRSAPRPCKKRGYKKFKTQGGVGASHLEARGREASRGLQPPKRGKKKIRAERQECRGTGRRSLQTRKRFWIMRGHYEAGHSRKRD